VSTFELQSAALYNAISHVKRVEKARTGTANKTTGADKQAARRWDQRRRQDGPARNAPETGTRTEAADAPNERKGRASADGAVRWCSCEELSYLVESWPIKGGT
jgi:hypothetical protein